MDRTPAGMYMRNPPHYFSSEIYGRTKSEVPCSIGRWEDRDSEKTAAVESVRAETICAV